MAAPATLRQLLEQLQADAPRFKRKTEQPHPSHARDGTTPEWEQTDIADTVDIGDEHCPLLWEERHDGRKRA